MPEVATPVSEQAGASKQSLKASPIDEAAKPATLPPTSDAAPTTFARLKVVSNLPANVWINEKQLKNPRAEQILASGRVHTIEVSGKYKGKRFLREMPVKLKAGETKVLNPRFKLLLVQLQGMPDGMQVLSLDGQMLGSQRWVSTYEGWHTLKLVQTSTGKNYSAECRVLEEEGELCQYDKKTLMPSP